MTALTSFKMADYPEVRLCDRDFFFSSVKWWMRDKKGDEERMRCIDPLCLPNGREVSTVFVSELPPLMLQP